MNIEIAEWEYTSIRSELISRIDNINAQASIAWTTIIASWVMGVSLYVIPHAYEINDVTVLYWLGAAQSVSMVLPIFFLLPMAVKSGENLRQIVSLSCYIRVFYESFLRNRQMPVMYWETANNALSPVNTDKGNSSKIMKMFFNQEYLVMAIASMALYVVFAILNSAYLYDKIYSIYFVASIVAYIVLGIISVVSIVKIREKSCVTKNMMDIAEDYTKKYIYIAIQLGKFKIKEGDTREKTVEDIYDEIYGNWTAYFSEIDRNVPAH